MFLLQLRKPHIFVCMFTFGFATAHCQRSPLFLLGLSFRYYLICLVYLMQKTNSHTEFTTKHENSTCRSHSWGFLSSFICRSFVYTWFFDLLFIRCCNCVRIFRAIPNYFSFSTIFFSRFFVVVVNIFGGKRNIDLFSAKLNLYSTAYSEWKFIQKFPFLFYSILLLSLLMGLCVCIFFLFTNKHTHRKSNLSFWFFVYFVMFFFCFTKMFEHKRE